MNYYSEKTDLKILARKLKWRVYGLLAIYGLIIVASLVLFIVVLKYASMAIVKIIYESSLPPKRATLLMLLPMTAILISIVSIGTIIDPWLKIRKHKQYNKRSENFEIKRTDYPQLFSFIDNVVKELGCRKPKHVYLNEECNASVNYPKKKGWFFHSNQNLTIGIPLLFGLNKTELKSILAHEFGHFSQKSIAVTRTANLAEYICNALASLVYYSNGDSDIPSKTERLSAKLYTKIMHRQFTEVLDLNAVLSRAQEYDADKYAYEIVGTDGCLSALTKVEETSLRWDKYFAPWLVDRIDEKLIPKDIHKTFSEFSAKIDSFGGDALTPKTHMTPPIREYDFRITAIYDPKTHPSLFKRCNAIASLPVKKTEWDDTPAFDFFPKQAIEDIYNSVAIKLTDQRYPKVTESLKKEEFNGADIISTENLLGATLDIFYSDSVFYEDDVLDQAFYGGGEVEFPFTLENISCIRAYLVAQIDLRRLRLIADENSPNTVFRYNGAVYNGTNTPLEEQDAYFEPLYQEAHKIASDCNRWLKNQIAQRPNLAAAFQDMILCQKTKASSSVEALLKLDMGMFSVEIVREQEKEFRRKIAWIFDTINDSVPFIDYICEKYNISESNKEKARNLMKQDKCTYFEDLKNFYSSISFILDKAIECSWNLIKYELILPAIMANNEVKI